MGKRLGIKEQDELINKLDFEPLLKQWTHQVRWLYDNCNKCTPVISEKSVRLIIFKLQERIKELETSKNLALNIGSVRDSLVLVKFCGSLNDCIARSEANICNYVSDCIFRHDENLFPQGR